MARLADPLAQGAGAISFAAVVPPIAAVVSPVALLPVAVLCRPSPRVAIVVRASRRPADSCRRCVTRCRHLCRGRCLRRRCCHSRRHLTTPPPRDLFDCCVYRHRICDRLLLLRLRLVATIIPLANTRRQVVNVDVVDVFGLIVRGGGLHFCSMTATLAHAISPC